MVVYNGPSLIDGKPIVAIVTGINTKSKNPKTGNMPQVWIMRSDLHPTEALRTGEDYSICGNCPHRPQVLGEDALKQENRKCYVNTMATVQVYKKYYRGDYPEIDPAELGTMLCGAKVRIGAYGDPAAVPLEVWDALLKYCTSTGYTHQWRNCSQEYSKYCMASCDTPIDVVLSTQMGYRTFFVQNVASMADATKQVEGTRLAWCPASKELGKRTTCAQCMVCSGTRSGLHSNVSILMH
jgi:hypothetical protein